MNQQAVRADAEIKPRYRADIDGLRAIAVTSVVFFHAGLAPFASGFVGVDIFFVISGYLIGAIILREVGDGRFSFAQFYARRARRILPALILVVLFTCGAGSLLLTANELKDVGALGTMALVGASNINFWQFQDYFADDSRLRTLLMTWSLGVEEQFYVVFPFLILLTARFARRWLSAMVLALVLGSFGLSLWWTRTAPAAAFYLLPARAWELGAGVLLAAWETGAERFRLPAWAQQLLGAGGLAALVFAIVEFDEHVPFPGTLALLPVAGTVALIASPASVVNRVLLSWRPVVFVGLVSYSWYLWHWPLLSLLRIVVPRAIPMPVTAAVAFISFGVAVLSWRFVERPFRHTQRRAPAVLLRYACALLAAIGVTTAIRAAGGLPQRFSPKVAELETFVAELRRGECLVGSGAEPSKDASCRPSPLATSVVAVLGDSHAWALSPSLRQIAAREGLGYEIFAKASCTPLLGVSVRLASNPGFPTECTEFKDRALQAILSDARVGTVVLAGYWSGPVERHSDSGYVPVPDDDPRAPGLALLHTGLRNIVAALTAAHKRVVLLQDVPDLGINPLAIALNEHMQARKAISSLFDSDVTTMRAGHMPTHRVAKHDDIRRAIDEVATAFAPAAKVRDPFPRICDQAVCTFNRDGEPLYFDHHHLSPIGASLALAGLELNLN